MRAKTRNPYSYTTQIETPSPAKYMLKTTFNKKGVYFNTKYKNSRSKKWNPPRSVRFSTILSEGKITSVGPGKYKHDAASMPANGVYSFAKFKNSKSRRFGKEKRNPLGLNGRDRVPGPGSYRLPSDFGWYESIPKKKKRGKKRGRKSKSVKAKNKKTAEWL